MQNNTNAEPKDFWNKRAHEFGRFENTQQDNTQDILGMIRKMGVDFSGKTVIDAGCGTGRYTLNLAKEAAHVTGVDISEEMLRFLNEDAKAHGISNINTICSDWNDFTPDRKYDIAFCTMSPALRAAEARKKLNDCATGSVVYMGFDGLRSSDVLDHLCPLFDITPKTFCDAVKMRAWLDENGMGYQCEKIEGEWSHSKPLDALADSAIHMLEAYGVPIDRDVVKANLEPFRAQDGTYTETIRFRSALIVWNK